MIFISDVFICVVRLLSTYQLGTGGRTQKAKPVRGVYLKPRIHTLCVLVITTNYSKTSSLVMN